MLIIQSNYGALADLVSTAGAIIAAGGAISLGWRGRTKWEPSEEDIPRAPGKVAGLFASVMIVILFAQSRDSAQMPFITRLAFGLSILCVLFLCLYVFLVAMQTYHVVESPQRGKAVKRNVIGGLWLTPEAKQAKHKKKLPVQKVLAGAASDIDMVWPRPSRALAKLAFLICYLGLLVSGTVALACAALILGAATRT